MAFERFRNVPKSEQVLFERFTPRLLGSCVFWKKKQFFKAKLCCKINAKLNILVFCCSKWTRTSFKKQKHKKALPGIDSTWKEVFKNIFVSIFYQDSVMTNAWAWLLHSLKCNVGVTSIIGSEFYINFFVLKRKVGLKMRRLYYFLFISASKRIDKLLIDEIVAFCRKKVAMNQLKLNFEA